MGSILIVMPKTEDAGRIAKMVQSSGYAPETEICTTGAEALRTSHDRDYGVVICTKKMRDMSYSELAGYLPSYFGMIVLTSDLSLETFSDHVVKLSLPVKRIDLMSTVEMLLEEFYRQRKKKKRQTPTKRKEEDKQIIDKAKQLLMERNGMSEPEAFRYIQKNSMDCGRNMVETAQMILTMNSE